MTPEQTLGSRQRLTGAARLLIGFCVAIVVVSIGIGAWRMFATVSAFPPTMTGIVEKDGDGWLAKVSIRNRAGQEAKNFVLSAGQLGEATCEEKLPIRLGDLAPLERRVIVLHFKKPVKPKGGEANLLLSYNCGEGRNLVGMTSAQSMPIR